MKRLVIGTLILLTWPAHSSEAIEPAHKSSQFKSWLPSPHMAISDERVNSRASASNRVSIDFSDLNQTLLNATTAVIISIPLPSGKMAQFELTPSNIMSPELASRYPSIRTFKGVQVGNPNNSGSFDITPHGFHGLFGWNKQDVYVEPQYRGNTEHYISYFKKDALSLEANKLNERLPPVKKATSHPQPLMKKSYRKQAPSLRTYRIAVAAVGEFTAFHGGTKTLGLAAVVTMINRVNEVYLRDLAIKLELVNDNDKLIFVDAATDPYANDDSDLNINTKIIDDTIGNDSYDIGHVVGTGGGGVAGFGVVCDSAYKGEGLTGSDRPTGDSFFIDFVAHEIGHQFKADHTFNGTAGSCEGNRIETTSYEPGSASTIMGYAGICDAQNLQSNSDPYFHTHSISEITTFITSGVGNSCGNATPLSNAVPVVNAGLDYTIPAQTPFELTGSATDSDGDSLNYSWEQYDLGPATSGVSEQIDDGKRPLFRVWNPTIKANRLFPKLSSILSNTLVLGETYATTSRDLNFRLLTRDGNGGVSFDAMKITVVKTSEAFAITSPDSNSQWDNVNQEIRWNVAGTNDSPISCPTVDMALSIDGGNTFEPPFAKSVINNGRYSATLPTKSSDEARIKVSCSNNVFFAISNGDFRLGLSNLPLAITGLKNALSTDEDTAISLTPTLFDYQGGQADSIKILPGDNYQVTNGTILPNENYNGDISVGVIGVKNAVETATFLMTITINPVNDTPVAQNDAATVVADSSNNNIDVLKNDSDPDSDDTLTLTRYDYAGSGVVNIAGNKIVYTPANGFVGSESVTYAVSDTKGASSSASIMLTVNAKPTPTTSGSSSSGGSIYWFSLLLMISAMLRKQQKMEE